MMSERRAGVTLMELLIAMSLLSLLSLGVVMAMRVGLGAMERANTRLQANRRAVGAQRVLEQQIAGFMPVSAEFLSAGSPQPVWVPFFQGEPESMRFVSSYSLEEGGRGRPHILEFHVIPGEAGRGVRLVVNERIYTGPLSTGATCGGFVQDPVSGMRVLQFAPIAIGPQSFVLADKLARCHFLYREEAPPPELERWVPRWVQQQWPTGVKIDMAPLDSDLSQIPPVPITAPIRVSKSTFLPYADQ